jgi:hypothetical protein
VTTRWTGSWCTLALAAEGLARQSHLQQGTLRTAHHGTMYTEWATVGDIYEKKKCSPGSVRPCLQDNQLSRWCHGDNGPGAAALDLTSDSISGKTPDSEPRFASLMKLYPFPKSRGSQLWCHPHKETAALGVRGTYLGMLVR